MPTFGWEGCNCHWYQMDEEEEKGRKRRRERERAEAEEAGRPLDIIPSLKSPSLSLSLSAIFGSAEGDEGENERGIQYLSDIMTICNHTYYFM